MTNPLNVAVIGAGLLGSRHARVFHEQPDARLAAVIDVDPRRAGEVAGRYGAAAYASLGEALLGTPIDAVSIATPDHLHHDLFVEALKAGKHALVEKPLATSAAEARSMVEAAAASGRVAMVNYSQRYVADHAWIRDRIEAGEIGAPRFVISVKFDTLSVPTGMIASWTARTSPIYFMSSHDLDLTHWMLKSDPIEVVARDVSGVLQGRGVDAADGLNALIRFGNGASANFHTSWIHPNTYPKIADGYIQFIGSEGAIFYNNRTRTAEIFNTRGGHKVEFTGPHTADEVGGKITGAFVSSLRHFIECIRDGREPDTSARRALPMALAQAAILESAKTGQPVAL